MDKYSQIIFDKNVVEFVTVTAEYCGFLEKVSGRTRRKFVDTSLKLLPLLYLKASMLPQGEQIYDTDPETFVNEGDYEYIRAGVASILQDKDDYLDVFLEDMVYSDTPIHQNISENLADIYQVLKDFICVYQLGFAPAMNDALVVCENRFKEYWGQRLLNAMRALHDVKYNFNSEDEPEEDCAQELFDDEFSESDFYDGLDGGDEEK